MPSHRIPSEKTVLAGLVCFGVLAVLLGAARLERTISAARIRRPTPVAAAKIPTTPAELDRQQRERLATQDTDGDGLNDADELERTKTSPYLKDSDSDGTNDREEVAAGTDPNCPAGQQCAVEEQPIAERPVQPSPAAVPIGSAGISGTTLRQSLEQLGLPREQIAALSDEQLQGAYANMLQAIGSGSSSGAPASPLAKPIAEAFTGVLQQQPAGASADAVIAALPKTPSEIRGLLRQTGFDAGELARISDTALLDVWNDVLAELRKQLVAPPAR